MGRPRKTPVAAASAALISEPVTDAIPAAICFENEGEDGIDDGDGHHAQVDTPGFNAPTSGDTVTTPPPVADFNTFIREMQMLRQVMVQQRDEIDHLKSSLFKNQQERLAEQTAALAMHERLQQLSEQLLTARSTPPVFVAAKELMPPVPPHVAPAFRATPPHLPRQAARGVVPAIKTDAKPVATPHARLGLNSDLPNTRKSRQNHVAELQTGSRYIVKGTNGLS